MPRSRQRRRPGHGEIVPPLTVLERINYWLEQMCNTWPTKELTDAEIQNWRKDLSPFSVQAIDYAFDTWRRNGHFFPVYGDILDMCVAWHPEAKIQYRPGCSAECLARHGKGYSEADVKKLIDIYGSHLGTIHFPMSESEMESLLVELDHKRPGGPPEWRRTA